MTLKMYGEEKTIVTMETLLDVGSDIKLELKTNYYVDYVSVDFGNDVFVRKEIRSDCPIVLSGKVGPSKEIKIIGDDESLSFFQCVDGGLTTLDISLNKRLKMLACIGNNIDSLDVTKNFELVDLRCDRNQIRHLDVSNAQQLTLLTCVSNHLITLDVSNNQSLSLLNCNLNQLTDLSIGHNISLTRLECGPNLLTTLDVSGCPNLKRLSCGGNKLSTLNLKSNLLLKELFCAENNLEYLDVKDNIELEEVICCYNNISRLEAIDNYYGPFIDCRSNRLTFETIPVKRVMKYYPQQAIVIPDNIEIEQAVDLSHLAVVNGETTDYRWKTKSGENLISGIDYTIDNGKTTFIKAQNESVYCEMTNSVFPLFTDQYKLKTSNLQITQKSSSQNPDLANSFVAYIKDKKIIVSLQQASTVFIFNVTGALVYSQQVAAEETIIEMPVSGLYVVCMDNKREKVLIE
jgi:hypothetical protein